MIQLSAPSGAGCTWFVASPVLPASSREVSLCRPQLLREGCSWLDRVFMGASTGRSEWGIEMGGPPAHPAHAADNTSEQEGRYDSVAGTAPLIHAGSASSAIAKLTFGLRFQRL